MGVLAAPPTSENRRVGDFLLRATVLYVAGDTYINVITDPLNAWFALLLMPYLLLTVRCKKPKW